MAEKPDFPQRGMNWHIDPKALSSYYGLSGIQPLTEEGAVRLHPTFGEAVGYREIVQLRDGFQVVIGDITCQKEAYLSMRSDDSLKFHYRLEGMTEFGILDRPQDNGEMSHYRMGILLHPEGLEKFEHYLAGEHERSVILICEPQFLREIFEGISTLLPREMGDYIETGHAVPYRASVAMSTEMVTAANAILANRHSGSLRRCYIRGCAEQLLALSLQTCIDFRSSDDSPDRDMSQRDKSRMNKARSVLEASYVSPPTIAELARHIGLNEAKLMHDFKQLFGQTIFDFTQNLRMDEAKRLLENTELSITEIAFEVGYEYSSNFTTAFKRRFGITPSAARAGYKN